MKSLILKIVASLFIFAALIYSPFVPSRAIASEDKVKIIGLSLPLSRSYESLGKQMRQGAKLAFEAYLANHPDKRIELKILDDQCNEEAGKDAAQKLIQMDVNLVAGYLCYKAFNAAQEVLAPQKTPTLSATLRHPHHADARQKKGWKSFTFGGNRKAQIKTTAEILLKAFHQKPYALIDDGSIEARNFIDAIRELADERGISPIYVDNFRPLQPSQSALIRRLRKAGASAAFIAGDANDIAIIARDAAAQNLELEIIGGEELNILPYIRERNEVPEGTNTLYAIMKPDLVALDSAAQAVSLLKDQSLEAEDYHLLGYAMMQVALKALESDNPAERLQQARFDTILGAIDFDENGEASPLHYQLHQWQGDHWEITSPSTTTNN